ncbi:hypothetical protein [Flavobacterium sp. GCM10023249]|uniref:hypothetical protein n=1 Tax=unclassified Flavobacterium TaxID=196869 RepID=UPI00361323AF
MKKIIVVLLFIVSFSCKKNNQEQKLIYKQLLTYKNELKAETEAVELHINSLKERKVYKNSGKLDSSFVAFENSFKKLNPKDRLKKVQILDSFTRKYPLYLRSTTSDYNTISDTIFNTLIEIEFYRIKKETQSILLRNGCK